MRIGSRKLLFPYRKFILTISYAIVIFALIKPDSLGYLGFEWLEYLLIGLDGLLLCYLLLLVISGVYKISKITYIIILYFIIGLVSTALHTCEFFVWIKIAGPAIATCLMTDYMMQRKRDIFFSSIYITLSVCYLFNLITIIYFPDGMYQMENVVGDLYLMGYHNGMIYNLIPLCGVSLIISYLKKGKLLTMYSIFAIALSVASVFIAQSGSGIVQMIIWVLLIFCADKRWINKMIKPSFLFGAFFVFSILLNVFRMQYIFSWLIVGLLNKDLTITNRVYLWDSAIEIFKSHPFLGIGYGANTIIGIYGRSYSHPHSLFLDILSKGGICLMGIFLWLLSVFSNKFKRAENKVVKKIILVVIGAFLVGEIVNSTQYKVFFWMFFVLIGYCETMIYGETGLKK